MRIKRTFAKYKVYLDRSRQYTIYIAFFMSGATMVGTWASQSAREWLKHHALVSVIAGSLIVLIPHLAIGWLDSKWIFSEENRRHSEANPVVTEILDRLKRIEEKLDK